MTTGHRDVAADRHYTCCPACKTVTEDDSDQYFLRVAVEIGWFNSGSGSPNAVSLDGLCEPCGDRIYNAIANALRREAGQSEVVPAEEPALQKEERE